MRQVRETKIYSVNSLRETMVRELIFMNTGIINEKQNLTYLRWSHIRGSSGTAGNFLKSESTIQGRKIYYKLSNFDPSVGVIGHECINELIVDRLLTILGVDHLHYELINADIEVEGKIYNTYLCASEDYKKRGEAKTALDDYCRINSLPNEMPYDFCIRNGWCKYIDQMIAVDYLILNRDRHGANIEVLRDPRAHTVRLAPLFDHGLSLLCTCYTDEEAASFDIIEDKRCQNYIGSSSCLNNLELIQNKSSVFSGSLTSDDKARIFEGLEDVLSPIFTNRIWEMIYKRYEYYESL